MPSYHPSMLSHLHLPSLKKQINELYIVHAINSLAFSLIGIFIPIFLLQAGFTLTQVFSYFLLRYTFTFLLWFFVLYISNNTGLKRVLYARLPIAIIFLYLFSSLSEVSALFFLVAFLDGLQVALYWMPMHSFFARFSSKAHMGSQVSKWFSFPKLLTLFGPLLGGLITVFFGFSILFMVAIAVLAVSVIPLHFMKDIKPHVNFQITRSLKTFKKHPSYFAAAVAEGVFLGVEGTIWPIFVFLILGNVLSIGIVGTLLGLGSITFMLLLGKLLDKYNKKTILHIGVPFVSALWLARIFATTEFRIYAITLIAGFLVSLLTLPFASITYNLAKKNHIDEFILLRETALLIGRSGVLTLAIFAANQLWTLFLVAGASNLLFLLV